MGKLRVGRTESGQPVADAEADGPSQAKAMERLDPDEWTAGYLQVVKNVRLVTEYWGATETNYWVCHLVGDELEPGDFVITTPIPGIRADGTDPVRVQKSAMDNPNRVESPSRQSNQEPS